MWMRSSFFVSACVWSGCTSATSAAPGDDEGDDSDLSLEIAQTVADPGPRAGATGAGGPFAGLNAGEKAFFAEARTIFSEVDSVSGEIEEGKGLGPTFNGNACAQCHAEPDVGGTSPHPTLGHLKIANPQIGLATLNRVAGGAQQVPPFIKADGPIREARFINNPDGTPDGGVHGLYTIAGRSDAVGCVLAQPDFAGEVSRKNVSFRIPTPVFGLGLLESVDEDDLVANLASDPDGKTGCGVGGQFNRSGNDGTITRFGWKAQNKSLLIFAGEAYNVEQGVSNEVFPNERSTATGCQYNAGPEDATNAETGEAPDTTAFAAFMRLSAAPTATTSTPSELRGKALFGTKSAPGIGCVFCHSDTLKTGSSKFTGMSSVEFHPFTDLAIHHMGTGLTDSVQQGAAGGDQFRTAPLWGVGKRIFFLHDGRSTPANGGLVNAIAAHGSRGSEARTVVRKFTQLSAGDQQAIVDFLRSL
jgi:CxxC motif-containing protein (DUF1111 family)